MEDKAKETAGPVPAPSGAGIGLAAIARDMRERAEVAARHGERETCNASVAALLRHFADRVEEEAKAKEWAVASLLADNEALRALLSAPPRNCDVGTAEEQLERWVSFCNRNWSTNYASRGLDPCDDCELVEFGNCRCQLAWAQMPYEKKEAARLLRRELSADIRNTTSESGSSPRRRKTEETNNESL